MMLAEPKEMTQTEVNDFIVDSLSHPAKYWKNILNREILGRQEEILNACMKFHKVAVAGCHSSMKTFTMTPLTLWELTVKQVHGAVEIAPTGTQSASVFWKDMRQVYSTSPLARELLGNAEMNRMKIEVDPFRYAQAMTPSSEMSGRGIHERQMRIILDEGNGLDRFLFDTLDGIASSGNVMMTQLGNPTHNSGLFYDSCTDAYSGWYVIYISAFDSPNLTSLIVPDWFDELDDAPGYIEPENRKKLAYLNYLNRKVIDKRDRSPLHEIPEYRELWNNVTPHSTMRHFVAESLRWARADAPDWYGRVLGVFPPAGEAQFFNRNWVEDANRKEEWEEGKGMMIWGIDPAGLGKDEFALVGVQIDQETMRHKVVVCQGFQGEDSMEQAQLVMAPYMSRTLWVNIDRLGPGDRVAYDMKLWAARMNVPVYYFTSSMKSTEPLMFKDLKTQAYCHTRDMLQSGMMSGLTDGALRRQMVSMHYDPHARVTSMETKKNMRKRLGPGSPDRCDALVYAMFPLFQFVPYQARLGVMA